MIANTVDTQAIHWTSSLSIYEEWRDRVAYLAIFKTQLTAWAFRFFRSQLTAWAFRFFRSQLTAWAFRLKDGVQIMEFIIFTHADYSALLLYPNLYKVTTRKVYKKSFQISINKTKSHYLQRNLLFYKIKKIKNAAQVMAHQSGSTENQPTNYDRGVLRFYDTRFSPERQ